MGRDDVTTEMGGDTRHNMFCVPGIFFICFYFLYNILTLRMGRDIFYIAFKYAN